ncbi:hypothetical protein TARUN_9182 [Trichoderma arundinaceum]|uniref:Uncharacterized protein n=1 Tax=Trichoderma arundinaceum TaxID=490622 RepID=A0A395NAD3_TRIAR|nr:hypothetical protein TARUN_9182 [Trichoderma arundinaceum]
MGVVVDIARRSEGVDAEEAMNLTSGAGDGEEGISLSSRAIVRNVSKMLWKLSWRRRRRMCYISRPFCPQMLVVYMPMPLAVLEGSRCRAAELGEACVADADPIVAEVLPFRFQQFRGFSAEKLCRAD